MFTILCDHCHHLIPGHFRQSLPAPPASSSETTVHPPLYVCGFLCGGHCMCMGTSPPPAVLCGVRLLSELCAGSSSALSRVPVLPPVPGAAPQGSEQRSVCPSSRRWSWLPLLFGSAECSPSPTRPGGRVSLSPGSAPRPGLLGCVVIDRCLSL